MLSIIDENSGKVTCNWSNNRERERESRGVFCNYSNRFIQSISWPATYTVCHQTPSLGNRYDIFKPHIFLSYK